MQILDNVNKTVKDDLAATIMRGDKLSVAAACFSIYAYHALKKQLDSIAELRFIFTSPTFLQEKAPKAKREFYIPRLNRERSLYGTEFEVKLRNELTQKAIARECADWILKKVQFRSNLTGGNISGFMNVVGAETTTYMPLHGFTTADIGCERGNNIINPVNKMKAPFSEEYMRMFDQIWNDKSLLENVTDQVLEGITAAYNENSPEFVYFVTLYNIFSEFLENISEDVLPNEATGFKETKIWNKLYDFQKDATLAIINKLEKFNGCILADSVGLGKTFTALSVIKYYELRNRMVLVLCPKKLGENWHTFKENYLNNPIAADRLRYDVLYHTDLSRDHGLSGGIDLAKLNWGNYDLIVIDESHNFRNGGDYSGRGDDKRENRYLQLLNKVIRKGVKTKVLMLSATPVNNGFSDLRHQLEIAYEGNPTLINDKLNTSKPIDVIFRNAQTAFNKWSKLDPEGRTTDNLLRALDFDFFTVLDSVTIARSRKHIEKYYNITEIGNFPERMKPLTLRPRLTDLESAIDYDKIYEQLTKLNLAVYTPTDFLLESRRAKYVDPGKNIDRAGRESGIRRLMCINLLKRLESSVYSFRITIDRVKALIDGTITDIDAHMSGARRIISAREFLEDDFDGDDRNTGFFDRTGKKLDIDLADMDYISWRAKLAEDSELLELLALLIKDITPEHDTKLQALFKLIADKMQRPFNTGNKKILLFSAFSDTVDYLYNEIAPFAKERFGLDTAMITGTTDGKMTVKLKRADMNTILTLFSPLSKDKELLMPDNLAEIDVLIATDCISEGQNLQDCDYCVNYDIHWNPVRIIQRFGRIDRIGSRNDKIQLVNFWPNIDLDKYLELKGRVETRMKASVMTAAGDDNPIDPEEQGDLEYRKAQLEKLEKMNADWALEEKKVLITSFNMHFSREYSSFAPFKYKSGDSNDYYNAYNAVKHNRAGNFEKKATLHFLLRALSALFLLNVYYRNTERIPLGSSRTLVDASFGSDIFTVHTIFKPVQDSDKEEQQDSMNKQAVYIIKADENQYLDYRKALRSAFVTKRSKMAKITGNRNYNKRKYGTNFIELAKQEAFDEDQFYKIIEEFSNIDAKPKTLLSAMQYEAVLNKNQVIYPSIQKEDK